MDSSEIALAFVGCGIEDAAGTSPANSRAGQLFQEGTLRGLSEAGIIASIFSVRPIPSFPKSKTLFVKGGLEITSLKNPIVLIPFVNITPVKQFGIGLALFWRLLLWRMETRQYKYHIIHTYNLTVPPGLFIWVAARLFGTSFSASLNDIHIPGDVVPRNMLTIVDFWLHRFLIPKLDMMFVVSDAIANDFTQNGDYCRLEGGISDFVASFFRDQVRRIEDNELRMAFAGSLDAPNGIDILLKAFSLNQSSNMRLLIAGDGPLRQSVIEASQKDSRISYLGMLALKDVLSLYAQADLLLNIRITRELNTKYFFPSKMMEYMASGTPVLTTATGHVKEEFSDLVYLLEDETAEGISLKLQEISLIPPVDRIARSSKARRYMLKNKTWKAQGAKMLSFWEDKIHSRNGKRE